MKVLCLPDLHLTDSVPRERIDNYTETLKRKFDFILETAVRSKCGLILQPGDFFNSPTVSYDFLCWIINSIKSYGDTIVTTTGQHDLRYRNFDNIALRALSYACSNLIVLHNKNDMYRKNNIAVYASSFGKKIPDIEKAAMKNQFNILITHRMIIQEKIWSGQQDAESSNLFLRNNKFDLIVSGDNHQGFIQSYKGRYLINCGSMMRSRIDQINHKPFIVLFDTDSPDKLEQIKIPISAPLKVFDLQKTSDKKESNVSLDAFCNGLSNTKEMGLIIEDNLMAYYKENKIDQELVEIIKENMNGTF